MTMIPTVYVVQRPAYLDRATGRWEDKYDLGPARRFGQLAELLHPGYAVRDVSTLAGLLEHGLREFCSQDHLLAVGDPTAIAAAAVIAYRRCGQVSVLKWDRHAGRYNPQVVGPFAG